MAAAAVLKIPGTEEEARANCIFLVMLNRGLMNNLQNSQVRWESPWSSDSQAFKCHYLPLFLLFSFTYFYSQWDITGVFWWG